MRTKIAGAITILLAGILCVGATRAHAATVPFSFTFSGSGVSGSGTFQVTSSFANFPIDGCTSTVCSSTVTDLSGTLVSTAGSNPMTWLDAQSVTEIGTAGSLAACAAFGCNDNHGNVFTSAGTARFTPSGFGVGFSAGGILYNLNVFTSGALGLLAALGGIELCTGGSCTTLTTYSATFAPAAVPLPGALPLFATGLGALGLLGWRWKRKALAA